MSEDGADEGDAEPRLSVIVLDFLPHGRVDDDRPRYQKSAIAHALGVEDFALYELVLAEGERVSIGDVVPVDPRAAFLERVRHVDYDDISGGARSELEHVVRERVDADEGRVLEFYNEAQPISLRLHQLNLLPGIGDKLRDDIIEARRRRPFESLEDLDERIPGLHHPKEIVLERIMDELRDEDVKYKLFVRHPRREE